jgi:hypothetical protein
MFRGHYGNRTVQLPPRYPIEVIAMQMRKHHGIERRQVRRLHRRLGKPP